MMPVFRILCVAWLRRRHIDWLLLDVNLWRRGCIARRILPRHVAPRTLAFRVLPKRIPTNASYGRPLQCSPPRALQ